MSTNAVTGTLSRIKGFAPRRSDYADLPRSWKTDILAGVTVASSPSPWRSPSASAPASAPPRA
ncbi:hypothetical protein GORBP_060_00940 [Gordonia rubripertincta NBRC 101908]|uniref:Transposase n=1 Tax=Gordonia rubripertincta NBRC 101908 TaxID=1077975 RepID=A0ABQ0HTA1_GORRU|nr:hypothetical protein GORBP_060_00940 [Gordonia rubripertincta NBRC 101908]